MLGTGANSPPDTSNHPRPFGPPRKPPSTLCQYPKAWLQLTCEHGSIVWVAQRCRHCRACLEAKRRRTYRRIANGIDPDVQSSLLTLTSLRGTSWPVIMRAWSKLWRTIARRHPRAAYVAVKEDGALRGMKHLHIAISDVGYLPQGSLSTLWLRYTGARVVWISHIKPGHIARYLAKYLTNGDASSRKQTTYSKRWPKLPRDRHWYPAGENFRRSAPFIEPYATPSGTLVTLAYPDCPIYSQVEEVSPRVLLWLKLNLGLLPRPSLAASAT